MQRIVPLFAIVISVLMVSRIPYPHPLTQFVRGQRTFAQLIAIVFSLMIILIVRNYAVPLLCVIFVCWPPVKYAWLHLWQRRTSEESLF
jgi:phosphatidylserine synthase